MFVLFVIIFKDPLKNEMVHLQGLLEIKNERKYDTFGNSRIHTAHPHHLLVHFTFWSEVEMLYVYGCPAQQDVCRDSDR